MRFLPVLLLLVVSLVPPSRASSLGQHSPVQQDQRQELGSQQYGLDRDRFGASDVKLEHLLSAATNTASQDLYEQIPGLGRMLPGGGKGKRLLSLISRSAQLALKHSQHQQEPSPGPMTHLKLLGGSLEVHVQGAESASSNFKESTGEVAKANQKLATAEQPRVVDPCADKYGHLPAGPPSTAATKATTDPSTDAGRQDTPCLSTSGRWQLGVRRLLPGGGSWHGKHLLMDYVVASGGELPCLKAAQQGDSPSVLKRYKLAGPQVATGADQEPVAAGRMLPGGGSRKGKGRH